MRITTSTGAAGSGVVVYEHDGEYLVLTAQHVVAGASWAAANGQRASRMMECKYGHDVGCLIVKPSQPFIVSSIGPKPTQGKFVAVSGFGNSREPGYRSAKSTWGGIERGYRSNGQRDVSQLTIGKQPRSGDSGGAVWDSRGRVVGIVNARDGRARSYNCDYDGMVAFTCRVIQNLQWCPGGQCQPQEIWPEIGGGIQPPRIEIPPRIDPPRIEIPPDPIQGPAGRDGKDGRDGLDGRGIANMEIIGGDLYVTYTDGEQQNLGRVAGQDGRDGVDGENGMTPVIDPEGLAEQIQPHLQPIRVYWRDPKTGKKISAPVDVRLGQTLPLELQEND